jgi:hypothetical protein
LKSWAWRPSSWYWSFSATFARSSSARSAASRFCACSGVSEVRCGGSDGESPAPPALDGSSAAEIARSAPKRCRGGAPTVRCMNAAISRRSCDTSANERFSASKRWSWAPVAKSRTSR